MANDLFDDESQQEDWGSFTEGPTTGDLKVINDMIEQAAKIKEGLKKMEDRTNHGKALLKDLLEVRLPEKMQSCGYKVGDMISYGGIKVELKSDTYANVPSISAINDERDEKKREELVARREAGLAILEDKAPTLIKRKFEINIDKHRLDQVEEVKHLLTYMSEPPDWTEGKSVHPQTLSKWIKEVKSTGHAFSSEEEWAFGIFPRKVAKITK